MIFGKKGDDGEAKARISELERQVGVLSDALKFYADPTNWQSGFKYVDQDNATIFTDGTESAATVDKGSRAFRALEACKGT
jgi:hypothetical protein